MVVCGEDGVPKLIGDAYGVGFWKGIRKGWDHFLTFLTYSVGNGERVMFWHDPWCGDLPL